MLSNPKLAFLSASILPLISVHAQSTNSNCLSLKGSTACPSFQDAYINPTNLSSAWPWMSNVKDVASFDTQANLYFSDPTRFHATKFNDQLQCNRTAAQNTTLQWQKTILCGQWSQISYSAQCNVENRADPIMVCQDTCVAYSNTQKSIVQNPQICEADSSLSSYQSTRRNDTLTKDFVDCTNWTSLVSTNNATCVEGIENEGNCGFGSELSDQLCAYCDPTGNNAIDSCCYDQKTDLSGCRTFGHPNAALVKATMSIPPQIGASSTSPATSQTGLADNSNTNNNDDDGDAGLSKGQLAGAIVGSILGALLLGALLTFFLFKRRNNNRTDQENVGSNGGVYSNIAPVAAVSNEKGWNHSNQSHGGINSPQMAEKSVSPEVIGGGGAGLIGAGAIAASKGNEASSPQSRPISSLSASSGTDGRGTTVPLVRDQYSGHDILPGESVIAIYPYNASLNDELTLELEDRINVARLYDDGWALGTNASSGEQGAFPLVCVTSEKGDAPMSRANGTGTSVTGTSGTDDGLTSGNEAFTSDAEAVTADEGYVSASSRR